MKTKTSISRETIDNALIRYMYVNSQPDLAPTNLSNVMWKRDQNPPIGLASNTPLTPRSD